MAYERGSANDHVAAPFGSFRTFGRITVDADPVLMRRLHLVVGLVTAIAFLVSGAYMRFAVDPESLPPGTDLLYISRHIYMLGPALMHLVLSAYVRPLPGRVAARLQWTGTTLLVVSSILLVSAFVVEPIGGRGRTAVSAFGMFTFLGGSLLHVIAPRLGRRGDA